MRLTSCSKDFLLHVEKAFDVVKNCFSEPIKSFDGIFECEYFSIEKSEVNDIQSIKLLNDWTFIFIIEGSGSIECGSEKIKIEKDSAVLIAPNTKVHIHGFFSILKICSKIEI